jgi:mannose-6-phosphate isomerase-like protein (cupin superfamily)
MYVWVKVYAEGGENYLHTHEREDHVFVILDGEATFHDPGGKDTVLKKNQGILLQRGAYYSFTSTGNTPLVLLRVGAADALPHVRDSRKSWPGEVDDREARGIVPVEIPGQFFAPDADLP